MTYKWPNYYILFPDKPHNPMVNAGAISVSSLLKQNLNLADKFDFVSHHEGYKLIIQLSSV